MSIKDDVAAMTAGLTTAPTVTTKRAMSAMSAPGAMLGLNSGFRNLQAENEKLKKEVERGVRVRIDLCDDGDLHATLVDSRRVAELVANIRENGQSSPAVVRHKAGDRFEVVIGRHRKAAMLELGAEEWDVVVREMDDDQAERLSFYDNLWAPNISDFAKFRGLMMRKERRGFGIDKLSQESGMSRSMVQGLMSFGRLPKAALSIVEGSPHKFGFNMVVKLAALVDEHTESVVRVVGMVASGTLSQEKAPAEVLKLSSPTRDTPVAKGGAGRLTVEHEGRQFAVVDVGPKKLTITLGNKDDIEVVKKAVMKILNERAKSGAK